MLKPSSKKLQKVIIIVVALVFIFSNFYGVLLFAPKQSKAGYPVSVLASVPGTIAYVWEVARAAIEDAKDDIKAVFFKNVLGNFSRAVAKETAKWIVTGGKGEGPQFITDFEGFVQGYADAAVGDFLYETVNSLTGLNICNVNPSELINLAVPLFPDARTPKPKCTFTQLQNNWEKVGKQDLKLLDAHIGGTFKKSAQDVLNVLSEDDVLAFENKNLLLERSRKMIEYSENLSADIEGLIEYEAEMGFYGETSPEQIVSDFKTKQFAIIDQNIEELDDGIDFENMGSVEKDIIKNHIDLLKEGYQQIKTKINATVTPEIFSTGEYSDEAASNVFDPESNSLNAYTQMLEKSLEVEASVKEKQTLEATVNEGFTAVKSVVSGLVQTPAALLKAKSIEDLTKSDGAAVYTKSIVADSLGVLLETLWNLYMQKLLQGLANPKSQTRSGRSFSEFEQAVRSPASYERYVESLGQGLESNVTYSDLNLLEEFQINLTGTVNPNIYNNVLDPNFALAISQEMSIREALDAGRIKGEWLFSDESERTSGSLNIANIKKLRKARIVPLGLELAAEKAIGTDVTLRQVVDNFYNQESEYYGLVDPDWILKLPVTKCKKDVTFDQYGEIMTTNQSGIRYAYCSDFASCIREDGKGNCLDDEFVFCTAEKNVWRLFADECPAEYASCKTYEVNDPDNSNTVSLLKNTLNSPCSSNQAGCTAYIDPYCEPTQTSYFNRNVESCTESSEGCHRFIIPENNKNVYYKKKPDCLDCPDSDGCDNFIQECNPEDEACQWYTFGDDLNVPGVPGQFCPSTCVGYEQYTQQESFFERVPVPPIGNPPYNPPIDLATFDPTYSIIPGSETSCSSTYEGCTTLARQDGTQQSFSEIISCALPSNTQYQPKTFFTWQVTENGSPQLISWDNLYVDATLSLGDADFGAPAGFIAECTYEAGVNDLTCYRFYDSAGETYDRDITKLIYEVDDCTPYYLQSYTEDNCDASGGVWGEYPGFGFSCLYTLSPSLSRTCPANQNGCRAFTSNQSGNVYNLLFENFKDTYDPNLWTGDRIVEPTGQVGNDSLRIFATSLADSTQPGSVTRLNIPFQINTEYNIKLYGRTIANTSGQVQFVMGNQSFSFGFDPDWQSFQRNFTLRDTAPTSLQIINNTGSDIYIDNLIIVSENAIYIIKPANLEYGSCGINYDLSQTELNDKCGVLTEAECNGNRFCDWSSDTTICQPKDEAVINSICSALYFDPAQNRSCQLSGNEMDFCTDTGCVGLEGCTAYKDQFGVEIYATQMLICDAVGCRQVIDSKNTLDISDDSIEYYILDNSKTCSVGNKGCQRYLKSNPGQFLLEDVYLINDPDKYSGVSDSIQCTVNDLNCYELINDKGAFEYYNIDFDNLCVYQETTTGGSTTGIWVNKTTQQECADLPNEVKECPSEWNGCSEFATRNLLSEHCDTLDQATCDADGSCLWVDSFCNTGATTVSCNSLSFSEEECIKYNDAGNTFCNWAPGECGVASAAPGDCSVLADNELACKNNSAFCDYVPGTCQADSSPGSCRDYDNNQTGCNANSEFCLFDQPECHLDTNLTAGDLIDRCALVGATVTSCQESSFCDWQVDRCVPKTSVAIENACSTRNQDEGSCEGAILEQRFCAFTESSCDDLPGASCGGLSEAKCNINSAFCDWTSAECNNSADFDSAENKCPSLTSQNSCNQNYSFCAWQPDECNDVLSRPACSGFSDSALCDAKDYFCDWQTANCIPKEGEYLESYYVRDLGDNLNRGTCNSVDWNVGCVDFYNLTDKKNEILKVKKDRDCAEWVQCANYDEFGNCLSLEKESDISQANVATEICGDGYLSVNEECDDGNNDNFDGCDQNCVFENIVFVTKDRYTGDLGGVLGADLICQKAAKEASIAGWGRYRAWLSDGDNNNTLNASVRISHSDQPYYLLNGDEVASDWADLTDGTLANPINVTQDGNKIIAAIDPSALFVWTNTRTNGNFVLFFADCNSFSSESSGGGIIYYTVVGNLSEKSVAWTNTFSPASPNLKSCKDETARLYCFPSENELLLSQCGDLIKDPTEECDDGNFDNNDGCDENCKIENIVFVTEDSYAGGNTTPAYNSAFVRIPSIPGVNGIAGADSICQQAAKEANLYGWNKYKAWLTGMDQSTAPAFRFIHSTREYKLRSGAIIAQDWADLTDGSLATLLNVNENGGNSTKSVWSNTDISGKQIGSSANSNCENWNDNFSGDSRYNGNYGGNSFLDSRWTSLGQTTCIGHGANELTDVVAGLYCFSNNPIPAVIDLADLNPNEIQILSDNLGEGIRNEDFYLNRFQDLEGSPASPSDPIVKWKALEYSGYSIPNRPALQDFFTYSFNGERYWDTYVDVADNNTEGFQDKRFVEPVCKYFPSDDAPWPYKLSLEQSYQRLTNLYSPSVTLNDIGSGCYYDKVSAFGASSNLPSGYAFDSNYKAMCTQPSDVSGVLCKTNSDCTGAFSSANTQECSNFEELKTYWGIENFCLEYDNLSPVYGGIYSTLYNSESYQTYACLSFLPYKINVCNYFDYDSCENSPFCLWNNGSCTLNPCSPLTEGACNNAEADCVWNYLSNYCFINRDCSLLDKTECVINPDCYWDYLRDDNQCRELDKCDRAIDSPACQNEREDNFCWWWTGSQHCETDCFARYGGYSIYEGNIYYGVKDAQADFLACLSDPLCQWLGESVVTYIDDIAVGIAYPDPVNWHCQNNCKLNPATARGCGVYVDYITWDGIDRPGDGCYVKQNPNDGLAQCVAQCEQITQAHTWFTKDAGPVNANSDKYNLCDSTMGCSLIDICDNTAGCSWNNDAASPIPGQTGACEVDWDYYTYDCQDGLDNDRDGLIDTRDPQCDGLNDVSEAD